MFLLLLFRALRDEPHEILEKSRKMPKAYEQVVGFDGTEYEAHPFMILGCFETVKGFPESEVAGDVKEDKIEPFDDVDD